jgi:maleylpyruvate isomerase
VDHTAWAADVIHKGLVGLEALASETTQGGGGGRYAVGDAPTLADACLVPQIYNARRFGLDIVAGSGDYPTLGAVEAACAELPAFQQAHPDVQPDADA